MGPPLISFGVMSQRPFTTILVAALLCAAMVPLPPIIGIAALFVFAVIVRFHPDQTLPKAWLVYGALGGSCLFFATAFVVAYQNRELPMALYGLQPDKWVRFAFRFAFPVGGFAGSLVGYATAMLIRRARPRAVTIGAVAGLAAGSMTTAAYVAWLHQSLGGQFIKYPSVVVVFCLVVFFLLLTIGGVAGTLLGAIASRLCHGPYEPENAT